MIIYIQTVGMLMGRRHVYGQEQTPRGDGAAHSHHGLQAFLEKGYEKTSLQDIIRETGLSKGAIYHHFSSKEAIFETICNQIGQENEIRLSKIRDDAALTGEEKLRKIFRSAILHPNQKEAFHIMPYLLDHPRYLAMQMQEILHISVPEYIQPILEEGVADGSLQVSDIQAVGEAIMVLMGIWLQPISRPTTPEEMRARCVVFNQITQGCGLGTLLEEDLIDSFVADSRGI